MKIIILGANQVGSTLAENLVNENHDITVVDSDSHRLSDLQNRIDIRTVRGSPAHPTTLRHAGAGDADMMIAVTNNDEVNMVACQAAYSVFDLPTKIARIRASEYFKFPELFGREHLPVDVFISPEQLVIKYMERLIEHPGALQVLDFANDKVKLVAMKPFFGGAMVGKSIASLSEELNIEFRVVAIYRLNHAIIPDGETVIEVGDEVFFLAAEKNIRKVMGALRRLDQPYRRIIIAGGGNIGMGLAKALELRFDVKVIERNVERAEEIATELNQATVLNGHIADRELLFNENIESTDVFCAVTSDDEANIMSCMLAKRFGVKTVMALIQQTIYVDLVESSTIDIAISPQQATVSSILRYVRRGDIVSVHSLRRGAAEAIEIVAHGDEGTSRVIGRKLKDISLPSGATVAAVVRGDKVMIAHGDIVLETDDHVILFIVNKKKVRDIEKLFQVSLGFFG